MLGLFVLFWYRPHPLLNIATFLARFNISIGEFYRLTMLCGGKKESSDVHIHGLTAYTFSEWKLPIYYKTIKQGLLINTGETTFAVR